MELQVLDRKKMIQNVIEFVGNRRGGEMIWIVNELMQWRKEHEEAYTRLVGRGKFNLYDYDAGIYTLSIWISSPQKDNTQCVCLSVSTVDDGSWQAEGPFEGYLLCRERMEKLFELIRGTSTMPTEDEFNEIISPVGLIGRYTG